MGKVVNEEEPIFAADRRFVHGRNPVPSVDVGPLEETHFVWGESLLSRGKDKTIGMTSGLRSLGLQNRQMGRGV